MADYFRNQKSRSENERIGKTDEVEEDTKSMGTQMKRVTILQKGMK
jgi:hypothetical protein